MKVLNYKEFRVTDKMLASKSKWFANYIIDRILFYLFFITVDMASSLVNDNVNDMIKKLIAVAELLYVEKNLLLENDDR